MLPPAMMRPTDLVAAGLQQLNHVETLFDRSIVSITELSLLAVSVTRCSVPVR